MKNRYDCSKCPGYCCSYDHIEVSAHDIKRLAKHLEVSVEVAEKRYTKVDEGKVVLRHHKDEHYKSMCVFFDREARRCTVYEARPHPCRAYPYGSGCGYYDFLKFEREHQGDDTYVAVTR
jgi:Fe-S-cluster containining protein